MQSQNIAPHRYSLSQNTDKDVEFDLIPRTKSTIVDLNWNILSQASFDFLQLSNLQLNEEFEESTPDGRQVATLLNIRLSHFTLSDHKLLCGEVFAHIFIIR